MLGNNPPTSSISFCDVDRLTKLYRQIVGIPMGSNCAPLVADLFYFAMKEIIEAFKSTSRFLDDLLNIDNPYFEGNDQSYLST